ncbi:hypothetical protein [Gordonia humi]|uniref:Lipoprotein n=1 Tax=Gordonia humi TaxID=686429 RepID=A0A840F065_9ACTN|nr:hypothetical protein [Gordonia humi]MBB4137261.1 hypothetical protein [Gordonia humi]
MSKKTCVAALVGTLAVALTTACTPTSGPAAPSSNSSASAPSDGAVRTYRKAQAKEVMRQLKLNAAIGIPGEVDRGYAEAAAKDRVLFVFSWGEGCSWARTPDGALWRLHATDGGALVRDRDAEEAFRKVPGRADLWTCNPAANIPAADAVDATDPYRWAAGGYTWVRWNGAIYSLPSPIAETGTALSVAKPAEYAPAPSMSPSVPTPN